MVTYSKERADHCNSQTITPTTITQRFRLFFKREKSEETIMFKDEMRQTTHHLIYKMLNGKKFIIDNYYGETITLPDMQFIYKNNENE